MLPPPGRRAPAFRSGHLVKARYTPLQATVLGADEQGSAYHEVLRDADDLGGMPVVVADLHSALPAVLAAYFAQRLALAGPGGQPAPGPENPAPGPENPAPGPENPAPGRGRVGYVMLDG